MNNQHRHYFIEYHSHCIDLMVMGSSMGQKHRLMIVLDDDHWLCHNLTTTGIQYHQRPKNELPTHHIRRKSTVQNSLPVLTFLGSLSEQQ